MGLVTMFCTLTTTGAGELVVQTGDTRSVVDWIFTDAGLAYCNPYGKRFTR